MANTRKSAANIPKQPSAGTQPKATAATKENIRPRSSMATRPALAPKPSQEHASNGARDSEMDGEKDTETAALIASLRAEVDQLKKLQAAKPIEKKLEDIPRPTKIKSLQDAMGLSEDKKLYSYCRSVVRDVMAHAGLPTDVDWRNQDAVAIGKIAQVASSRNKHLRCYKGNWATIEIMKTLLKNRRSYHHRIGLPDICNSKDINGEKSDADSDDMYMKEKGDENGRDGNGSKDGNGSEDGNGNSGEGVDEDGNGYGDVDEEEFGAKDDEGRNGEGSSSAKQAGKRKATQDNEPATATRPKKKVNQVATQSTTKAALKRK